MGQIKLMVVDDEERFLETTQKLLKKKGIEAKVAKSGSEALDKLGKESIDIVILDVKMPGMDGIETLKIIKAKFPLTEVIMLTGHGTIESAVEGLKEGAFDYLTKPADIDELIEKAEDAFEKRKRHQKKIESAQMKLSMKRAREILETVNKEAE